MCICANMYLYLYVFCVRRCVYIYLWIYVGVSSFDLFILMFFSFFFHLLYHNENTAFLPALCYPSLCWCYSYLSAIKLQSQLLYVNFQSVCLFVFFFFCFQVLFTILWFELMAKWNLLPYKRPQQTFELCNNPDFDYWRLKDITKLLAL